MALPICTAPPERSSLSLVSSADWKGRAVDAVAARATADGDNVVARLWLAERLVVRNDPHVAAVDERVAQVAPVEVDRAVDGGNAHPIAVVADACDDALHHPLAGAARRAEARRRA